LKFTFAILGLTESSELLFAGRLSQSILWGVDAMVTLEEEEQEEEDFDDFDLK